MVDFNGNVSSSRGSVPQKAEGYGSNPLTEEIAKKILIDFKQKDTDTSMRVSFDELSNAIIKEYVANDYKRTDAHKQGETIADLLNYYQERAKEYDANGDGALNIDEYTAMFREKFEQAEKEAEQNRNIPPADNKTVAANNYDSSAVKFEKNYATGKKSSEIINKFVEE